MANNANNFSNMLQNALMQNPLGAQSLSGLGGGLSMLGSYSEYMEREQEARKVRMEELSKAITGLKDTPAIKLTKAIPDFVGTLTGWRGWSIKDDKLCGLGTGAETASWMPKQAPAARCVVTKDHRCPGRDCKCGYWSFNSLDTLSAALEPYAQSVLVLGTVELWGRVVECTNGFRSEFAYPKELWLLRDGLDYLSWEYGVPVRKK